MTIDIWRMDIWESNYLLWCGMFASTSVTLWVTTFTWWWSREIILRWTRTSLAATAAAPSCSVDESASSTRAGSSGTRLSTHRHSCHCKMDDPFYFFWEFKKKCYYNYSSGAFIQTLVISIWSVNLLLFVICMAITAPQLCMEFMVVGHSSAVSTFHQNRPRRTWFLLLSCCSLELTS